MNQQILSRSMAKSMPEDRATAREILLMHASALINRQVREQFWILTGGLGVVVVVLAQLVELGLETGYLDWPALSKFNLASVSQATAVLVFLLTAAIFLVGRLRMVRSEIDLLRLEIEIVSSDLAEQEVVAKPALSRTKKLSSARARAPRRITLRSSD